MRIAFISLMGGAKWGGSEAMWHSIALLALQNKDAVFVSIYDWGRPHDKIVQLKQKGAIINFRERFNPAAGKLERLKRFIRNRHGKLNKNFKALIDFKPQIVFISQGDSFDMAVHHRTLYDLLISKNIPYTLICHNHIQYGFLPPAEIYPGAIEIFKNASRVYFVSLRQWKLTERRLVTNLDNGCFTWNPLNMEVPIMPLTWPDEDIARMAIIASIEGNKGHDSVLEVLSMPQWKSRKWILNIYGDGSGKKYLQDLADFYGIKERVFFHGYVHNIISVWQENHLLLVPSAGEGLPISLAEAMACGRPAIVTDVGGNTELIKENFTGFIAASPTVNSFSNAMETAWMHKWNWKQMGATCYSEISTLIDQNPGNNIYKYFCSLIPTAT